MPAIGFGDDDIQLVFCEPCTTTTDRGWQLEAHEIERTEAKS